MVWGGDAISSSHSSSRSNVDLEIGCLIDLATGLVAFTVNGRELPTSYQVLFTVLDLWYTLTLLDMLITPLLYLTIVNSILLLPLFCDMKLCGTIKLEVASYFYLAIHKYTLYALVS